MQGMAYQVIKQAFPVYFNIGGGSKLPGSSIDPTVNRLARYNIF
jgi:hypothetical protein